MTPRRASSVGPPIPAARARSRPYQGIYQPHAQRRASGRTSVRGLQDFYEHAVKLTRKTGGSYSRFGSGLNYDQPVMSTHLPSLAARFDGQMYTFSGDRPMKVDVASPAALEAVGW